MPLGYRPYGERGRQEFLANVRQAQPYVPLLNRHERLTTHNSEQFMAQDLAYDKLDAFHVQPAPMRVDRLVDDYRAHTQGPRQGPRSTADFYIFHADDFDQGQASIERATSVNDDKKKFPWA